MRLVAGCVAALALAGSAAAALPRAGTFDPGRSLGGIRLGETATQVKARLGTGYGICKGCATTTWYYTYRRFDQHGLAVELSDGRVSAVYTLWRPAGWKTPRGLALGAVEAQVTELGGATVPVTCTGYQARVRDEPRARTVYYVVDGALWGFGLVPRYADPCR